MTDRSDSPEPSPAPDAPRPAAGAPGPSPAGSAPRGGRWRRWRVAGLVAAVAGVLAIGACSHGPHRGWHDGPMSGPVDPERAARFTERMADRIVSAVDGTPEQKRRIRDIAQGATQDLMPLREQARTARRRAVEVLGAASVDRAALETLRGEQLALADRASKRIVQALADTAEVLTPEQRTRLAERIGRRTGRWS